MSQPKYGLRGKGIKEVAARFAAEDKAIEERKLLDKKAKADKRVNALRNVLNDLFVGAKRDELLDNDMPYITAADALDICNNAQKNHPNDNGIRRLKAEVYVDYINDEMKTYTVNEMKVIRNRVASENPSSRVASLVDKDFVNVSIFQEDYRKFAKLASEIKTQEDYEKVLMENGIVGDDLKTFRAQCIIAKLAQMNNPESEDTGSDEAGGEVALSTVSPNTGEELEVSVKQVDSEPSLEGPEPSDEGIIDNDPVELLGQIEEVNNVSNEVIQEEFNPMEMGLEDQMSLPAPEDLIDPEDETTEVILEDPSSDQGETIKVTVGPSDEDGEGKEEENPEESDERQAYEDPSSTLRKKLRKLLRRSLSKKKKAFSEKRACIMYYNADDTRKELDKFRAYNMVDALQKVTKYALESGLEGKVYANSKEAAIELESGNIVTFYLAKPQAYKKIANLNYADAYGYLRKAGLNLPDAENRVIAGDPLTAYGLKLQFNNSGDFELYSNNKLVRTADILNFRPILKDFVMEAASRHIKHGQDEDLMNDINEELEEFVDDLNTEDSGIELVRLDSGVSVEVEFSPNGEVNILTARDSQGNEIEATPEMKEEALSKLSIESSSVEDRLAKIGAVEAFTFKCSHCEDFSTVPMPKEACHLDCSSCGVKNTKDQIVASLDKVEDVQFNYLFKNRNASVLASNLSDRGVYTDVISGMLHVAEGALSEDDVLKMIEEEMDEIEKEADGPLGGDGQGAGPQYPNMVDNQSLRQNPVPGVQEQQKELIQYDTGTASPDQQRDEPQEDISQMTASREAQIGGQILSEGKGRKSPLFDYTKEKATQGLSTPKSDDVYVDSNVMNQLSKEFPNIEAEKIRFLINRNKNNFKGVDDPNKQLQVARKILKNQGQQIKKASIYKVSYILEGEEVTKRIKANDKNQIYSYINSKIPKAFIKSAQDLSELESEDSTASEYLQSFIVDNELMPEDVNEEEIKSFVLESGGEDLGLMDVDFEDWWNSKTLDESEMDTLQYILEDYFDLDEEHFMNRSAQEEEMMPVPKSAPEAPVEELEGEESTFHLEQPVDSEAREEIKAAFMYYRHEGLGPAEAIKKFMTEYDDENYDQSEIIRICGSVYAGDPVTQKLDIEDLIGNPSENVDEEIVASLKKAFNDDSSILRAVLKVANRYNDPLMVIRTAAKSLSSFDSKGYTKKQYQNMDMSLKSPKAFTSVTSKNVKGEGSFPKSDTSLRSDKNSPNAFGKVDSENVSGDPTSGGKENAMNVKDVLSGDKAHNNHFKNVNSKNVSGDPTSGGKEGANTKDVRGLRDTSQNAFGSVNSKPSKGYDDISHPRVDNGSRSLRAYAEALKTRIASLRRSASPDMKAEIEELKNTLSDVKSRLELLDDKVKSEIQTAPEVEELPPFEDGDPSILELEEDSKPSRSPWDPEEDDFEIIETDPEVEELPPFEDGDPSILELEEDFKPSRSPWDPEEDDEEEDSSFDDEFSRRLEMLENRRNRRRRRGSENVSN